MKQYMCPVRYFQDNLIFSRDSGVWACFRLDGMNYDFKSDESKIEALDELARFIANAGKEAKIYVIPVAQDVWRHMEQLKKRLDTKDVLYDEAVHMCDETGRYLSELTSGTASDCEIYLMVRLRNADVRYSLSEMISDPCRRVIAWASADERSIAKSEIEAFRKASESYLSSQKRRMGMHAVNEEVLQWLIKRMYYRGESFVPIRTEGKGIWKAGADDEGEKVVPLEKDIVTLNDELLQHEGRCMKVTHQDGSSSYQTFLAVSHIRDRLIFPGGEWLMILQEQDYYAEVLIEINAIEYQKAVKKIDRNREEVKGQIRHVAENDDDIPEELFDSKRESEDLKSEIRMWSDPLLECSVFICMADTDKERLERDALRMKEWYEDREFSIERPFTDQMELFYEFMPGAYRVEGDYIHRLSPRALAASMFAARKDLGDKEGYYIGQGENGKLIFLRPSSAPEQNRSASMLASGTLGGGKSFNMNMQLYLAVMFGGKGLIIDPKGERSGWEENIPELRGQINVTSLSSGEADRGKLDPFVMHKDAPAEAAELALNILCELYAVRPGDDEYILINETIAKVVKSRSPSMLLFLKLLMQMDGKDELYRASRKLSRRMRATMSGGMSSLIFGRGGEKGLSYEKRVNILQIQNLDMPEPGKAKKEYTFSELLSTVLMLPITSFAKKFAMSDPKVYKTVILDESWVLRRSAMGQSLYSFLARMGRSLNSGAIFIGHSVNDIDDEGLKSAITYKFIFRTPETAEAQRALRFLDTEPSEENIRLLKSLANGECLFQDMDDNVGLLRFDPVFSHLEKAFDTNPARNRVE